MLICRITGDSESASRPRSPSHPATPPSFAGLLLAGVAVAVGSACDGGSVSIEAGVPPAVAVRVIPDGASISGVGETAVFRLEAMDAEGRKIPSPGVSWPSLNLKVATVDDQGVARALMSGQATIAAEVDGVVGSAVLTVSVPGVQPVTSWTASWKGPVLEGVWGASPDEMFAVGEEGAILHYDGNGWGEMDGGTGEFLFNVWGSAPDDVFVVGYGGTILHYDGTAWSPMAAGTATGLKAVWGASPEEVFAVGYDGIILRFDGATWGPMASGTPMILYGVWGSSLSEVTVVGLYGAILRGQR